MYYLTYTDFNMVGARRYKTILGVKNFLSRMKIENPAFLGNQWSLFKQDKDFHSTTQREYLLAFWNSDFHHATSPEKELKTYKELRGHYGK